MRKMKLIPFLLIAILLFNTSVSAQNPPAEKSIDINISASELLPGDLIIFNININAEGDTPREAFETHKKRESALADLLKKFKINETDINFQPVHINKRYSNNEREMVPQTSQQVSVTFNDFKIYEDIQVSLIEHGFDSFSGNFSSTELEKGKEKALEKAILLAKQRAEFIAKTSGVKLGTILKINYSDNQMSYYRVSSMDMPAPGMVKESTMMDFSQTVSVTASINIEFAIL